MVFDSLNGMFSVFRRLLSLWNDRFCPPRSSIVSTNYYTYHIESYHFLCLFTYFSLRMRLVETSSEIFQIYTFNIVIGQCIWYSMPWTRTHSSNQKTDTSLIESHFMQINRLPPNLMWLSRWRWHKHSDWIMDKMLSILISMEEKPSIFIYLNCIFETFICQNEIKIWATVCLFFLRFPKFYPHRAQTSNSIVPILLYCLRK